MLLNTQNRLFDLITTGSKKTWAVLWKIERLDGQIFRFTDHNSLIIFEGENYTPMNGFNCSARQFLSQLDINNFEAQGIISDDTISQEDLRKGLFRDAKLTEIIIDWRYPFLGSLYRNEYWVKEITFDREKWFAQVEGLSQWLSKTTGQRFSRNCRYNLGDENCGKDIEILFEKGTITEIINQRCFKSTGLTKTDNYYKFGKLYFEDLGTLPQVPDDAPPIAILVEDRIGPPYKNIICYNLDTKDENWSIYLEDLPAILDEKIEIKIDNDNNIYIPISIVGGSKIYRLKADGTIDTNWGTNGSITITTDVITSIAVDSQKNLYVAHLPDNNGKHIKKYNSNGSKILDVTISGLVSGSSTNILILSADETYLWAYFQTTTGQYRLKKLSTSTLNIIAQYTDNYLLSGIEDGCLDENGNLYLVGQAQEIDSDFYNIWSFTAAGVFRWHSSTKFTDGYATLSCEYVEDVGLFVGGERVDNKTIWCCNPANGNIIASADIGASSYVMEINYINNYIYASGKRVNNYTLWRFNMELTEKIDFIDSGSDVSGMASILQFYLAINCSKYGSISPTNQITVPIHSSQNFIATPDDNYQVNKWFLDGQKVQTGGNSYNLQNITAKHTIYVCFKKILPTKGPINLFDLDMNEVISYQLNEGYITLLDNATKQIAVDDIFTIFPGCDKLLQTCNDKFSNGKNFGGFPFIPGRDDVSITPEYKPSV